MAKHASAGFKWKDQGARSVRGRLASLAMEARCQEVAHMPSHTLTRWGVENNIGEKNGMWRHIVDWFP